MSADRIYLHPEIDEKGAVILVDQHGRQVEGVRHVGTNWDHRGVVSASIDLICHHANGKVIAK